MTISAPFTVNETAAALASRPAPGAAGGGVNVLLRIEGVAALATALILYGTAGFSWPAFALFFLAPDLAMVAYLAGPRLGAISYNLAHTYTLALALAAVGFFGGLPVLTASGLILIGHIGFDRALGFGLKYASGFGDTHLHRGGRR